MSLVRVAQHQSNHAGPNVCFVGGVHGDECGAAVLESLDHVLKAERLLASGAVWLLWGNLRAIDAGRRAIDRDLNRAFGEGDERADHEGLIAKEVRPLLSQFDYLVDLHSTSAPTRPFVAGADEPVHHSMAKMLTCPLFTYGWSELRGHNMLIDEARRQGVAAVILECGQTLAPTTKQTGFAAVLQFLEALGALEPPSRPRAIESARRFEIERIVAASTSRFVFTRPVESFEAIAANEVIAFDGEAEVRFKDQTVVVLPTGRPIEPGEEAFARAIERAPV